MTPLKQTPQKDGSLSFPYDLATLENKKKNKIDFFKKAKKGKAGSFVLLVLQAGLSKVDEKVMESLFEAVKNIPAITILSLSNEQQFGKSGLGNALAAADALLLLPSQLDRSVSELLTAMRYGDIPIVAEHQKIKGIVQDFDPINEKGNGFVYEKADLWNIFAAIIKAKENYKFPYDWENLMKACMQE